MSGGGLAAHAGTEKDVSSSSIIGTSETSDLLEETVRRHFYNYKPELYRYRVQPGYGETLTEFDQKQIATEIAIFDRLKNSELIRKPTILVFALCHNILIHSPTVGAEFLRMLNQPTEDSTQIERLKMEAFFAGELGEQLALDNLESADSAWSKAWAGYLSSTAIYTASASRIEKVLQETSDVDIQQDLIDALVLIGEQNSVPLIRKIAAATKTDAVQAKAIFALTELSGYDGLKYLEDIKTLGVKAAEERKSSLYWITKETNSKNKFGTEITNDLGFIANFKDIKSPVMAWLGQEGLLEEKNASKPVPLSKEKKDRLLDLLIESKVFGLEAVKAQLFLSLEKTDIDKLLRLRKLCVYSPSQFTQRRANTIGILIRHLRKTKT